MPPVRFSTSHRRWCLTLNNYSDADVLEFNAIDLAGVKYAVVGKEVAPTTGTPHLQGFFIFHNAQRLSFCRNFFNGRGHWEPARAKSADAAGYCKKDGVFLERGSFPDQSGRRTDLDKCIEWLDEFIKDNHRAPHKSEIHVLNPNCFKAWRESTFMDIARSRAHAEYPLVLQEGEPRPWQVTLEDELNQEADDRSVLFYYDPAGNSGKSWFQRYYVTKYGDRAQILGVGKRDDMAYMVDCTKCVFFVNVPRGGMEFLQYTVLEMLKDKMVVSPKYQSEVKHLLQLCHVVVFTNEAPDETKMSLDRFDIREHFY